MLRSTLLLRRAVTLAVLVPLASLFSSCSEDTDTDDPSDAGETAGTGGKASGGGLGSTEDVAGGRDSGRGATAGDAQGGDEETGSAGAPEITPPAARLAPVDLGAAGDYVILAKSAISNVPTSEVTGDLGLSPAAASYITGFSLTRAGTEWTASQVVGSVFAADNDAPTPSALTVAVADMQLAYTDAAGRPTPAFLNLGAGAIGGMTLTPGLYKWTSAVTVPANITLDGAPDDVWLFQITGNLTIDAAKRVLLSGGAQAKNVVWQVAGSVDLGATSHAEGIILSKTAIKLGAGASIQGRLLAQTAIDIANATVTAPAP